MTKDKAKTKEAQRTDEDLGEGAEAAPAPKKKFSLKTLLLFVVAPAAVAMGLGAAAFLFPFGGSEQQEADAAHGPKGSLAAPPKAVFYDLPEMLVNIASTGPRPVYLKLGVSLELDGSEATKAIEPVMPRVLDNFQIYLRELRLEDLQGSAGLLRLKEELIRRVNLAVAPVVVRDVLFKDMIIQ